MPGGLGHMLRVPAEKLHADRAFAFIEVQVFARSFVAAKHAFGRDEFGHEHIGAPLFA
jgi:hypothetical protein